MKVRIAKAGKSLTASKAKEILHDGTAQGHPLTDKQRKYFGYIAGGGTPKAEDGMSVTPLAKNVVQFNGPSHENGGIPFTYGGNKVEVEGGETGYKSPVDNSMHIMGNMVNPLTGRKFKEDSKRLAEKERKIDKLVDYSTDLVNGNDPTDKWGNLKFNAGQVMMQGGLKKKKEIGENKEWLAVLQKAMLEKADELGVDAQDFSKGKAQMGYVLPSDSPLSNKNVHPGFRDAFIKMMSEAPDFVQKGVSVGSGWRDLQEQERLYSSGLQKYGPQGVKTRVAPPGKSAHQFGMAADLQFSDPKAKDWMYQNATKYGIDFPLKKDDPNHMIFAGGLKGGKWKGRESMLDFGPEDQSTYVPNPKDLITPSNIPFNPANIQYPETEKKGAAPPDYGFSINEPRDYYKPSNATRFNVDQILPELYTAATNKPEPVWLQQYNPQLFQSYKVSFQDRLNQNQAAFNTLARTNAHNPSAQSALAAQVYEANNSVLGEEFRTNQSIEQDVVNKNISLLNDAQLKNLSLADTQYVRQAQTKSKVREQNQVVLDSIADKVRQHQLENRTLQVLENLYPNYSYDEKNNMRIKYSGPQADEWINWDATDVAPNRGNVELTKMFSADGKLQRYRTKESSDIKYANDQAKLIKTNLETFRMQKNLYSPSISRQSKFKSKSTPGINF